MWRHFGQVVVMVLISLGVDLLADCHACIHAGEAQLPGNEGDGRCLLRRRACGLAADADFFYNVDAEVATLSISRDVHGLKVHRRGCFDTCWDGCIASSYQVAHLRLGIGLHLGTGEAHFDEFDLGLLVVLGAQDIGVAPRYCLGAGLREGLDRWPVELLRARGGVKKPDRACDNWDDQPAGPCEAARQKPLRENEQEDSAEDIAGGLAIAIRGAGCIHRVADGGNCQSGYHGDGFCDAGQRGLNVWVHGTNSLKFWFS